MDEERRDALVAHPRGRFRDRRVGLDRDGRAAQEGADPREARIGTVQGPRSGVGSADALPRDRPHGGRRLPAREHRPRNRGRHEVAERVVDRADRHRRRPVRHHRRHAEDVARLEQIDDDVAGHELDLSLPDHAERLRRGTAFAKEHLPGTEVHDLEPRADLRELLVAQLGEGMVLPQERHRLHGGSIARAR